MQESTWNRLLPSHIESDRVAACLGIVSDNHMPERLKSLPPALFDALRGVDLVLHAGDVGEFQVLDRLSELAPVIAVHGNDGVSEVDHSLPRQQVISIAGQRILLYHSHLADPEEEWKSRVSDEWEPKLARRLDAGKRVGARVVVFGHTHIPMATERDGVMLLNPGAIAPPNARSRQIKQTVALLWILRNRSSVSVHVDLNRPQVQYRADVAWEAGFRAALEHYSASILTPELETDFERIRADVAPMAPATIKAAWLRAAHQCWTGELQEMGHYDVARELKQLEGVASDLRARLVAGLLDRPR